MKKRRRRIRAVIEETGYRPSVQATNASHQTSVPGRSDCSKDQFRVDQQDYGGNWTGTWSESAYQMLLTITNNNSSKELEYVDLFEAYPVDGIILVGTVIDQCAHKKKLKECKSADRGDRAIYKRNQVAYIMMIMAPQKHWQSKLEEKHPGRVAYIGVTREDKAAGAAREDGFREGLKEVGKELEESCLRRAKFTMESGYEQAVDLLEKEHDIDIISCATDTIAAGAIEAIAQYSPERKIQVTGFGDNQFLKAVTGGIRTVHFAYQTSGIKGARAVTGDDRIRKNAHDGDETGM